MTVTGTAAHQTPPDASAYRTTAQRARRLLNRMLLGILALVGGLVVLALMLLAAGVVPPATATPHPDAPAAAALADPRNATAASR